jgi:hypothetical protein
VPTPPGTGVAGATSASTVVPAQTKCGCCLTDHLGNEAIGTDETADPTLLGIIHPVVESTTFYGAGAKGGAAVNLLTANEAEPAVDDDTLCDDLDEPPSRQLADRWPSLPAGVPARPIDAVAATWIHLLILSGNHHMNPRRPTIMTMIAIMNTV